VYGAHTLEIWEYYAHTTNNFCELTAILHALQQIKNKSLPVLLHSDSAYAIGVSSGTMKAKKNVELVEEIRAEAAKFTNLHFLKVKAHSGIRHNEHVDKLCELARNTRESGSRRH
jgi:ribonuclease HI